MFKNIWNLNRNLSKKFSYLKFHNFQFNKIQFFNFTKIEHTANPIEKYADICVNNIKGIKGARVPRNVLGRGPGSGKGKTSGRGHKGYTARTGEPARHFEGGTTSISRRVPKRGFNRRGIKTKNCYLNLSNLAYYISKGKLDPKNTITIKDLYNCGAIAKVREGVKLLGKGQEKIPYLPPINVEVSDASKNAISKIKENGGNVSIKYRTKLTLKYHVKPHKFHNPILDPVPPQRKVERLNNLKEKGAR